MPELISEKAEALEASATSRTGEFLIQVLTPGWGSSGYYSPSVVEAAAPLVTVGTHMYVDHPTQVEAQDRPERSVRDIAAVVTEAGHWDDTRQAVVASCKVVPAYRDLMDADLLEHIGLSIRGSATDITEGEADGRRGRIVEGLQSIDSVDFVTRAGRGGKVLQLLESARVNARAIERGVAEATANDQRETLTKLVKDAHASQGNQWVWLRDFDETTCWFEIDSGPDAGIYQQSFTSDSGGLPTALTGDRTEVRQVTQYVPVHPAGQPNTQESKEDTMATIQIEESALAELRETAGRVTALESERDTEKARADQAEADLAEARKEATGSRISELIREADVDFDDLQAAGLKALAQVDEHGVLDEAAFVTVVAEAAAKVAEAGGAGQVRGHGQRVTTSETVSLTDLDESIDATFGVIKEA